MTALNRDMLLRYLHERGEMSVGERFGVEWRLLTDRAARDAFSEMKRMDRSLSLHFACTSAVLVPQPGASWVRAGVLGLTGAAVVAGSLLWLQDGKFPDRTAAAVAPSRGTGLCCPLCNASRDTCPHCMEIDAKAAGKGAAGKATAHKPRCSRR
jgi:hypothetical protein